MSGNNTSNDNEILEMLKKVIKNNTELSTELKNYQKVENLNLDNNEKNVKKIITSIFDIEKDNENKGEENDDEKIEKLIKWYNNVVNKLELKNDLELPEKIKQKEIQL